MTQPDASEDILFPSLETKPAFVAIGSEPEVLSKRSRLTVTATATAASCSKTLRHTVAMDPGAPQVLWIVVVGGKLTGSVVPGVFLPLVQSHVLTLASPTGTCSARSCGHVADQWTALHTGCIVYSVWVLFRVTGFQAFQTAACAGSTALHGPNPFGPKGWRCVDTVCSTQYWQLPAGLALV